MKEEEASPAVYEGGREGEKKDIIKEVWFYITALTGGASPDVKLVILVLSGPATGFNDELNWSFEGASIDLIIV